MSICHLDLGGNGFNSMAFASLFNEISNNISLSSLSFGNGKRSINKNRISREAFTALTYCIKQNQVIQILDLRDIGLGDRGVSALAKGFDKQCAIESINISKNEITEVGMEQLCAAIPLIFLTHLDLSHNPIGTKGARFLYGHLSIKKSPL